jgi:hypothetical protein
VTGFGSLATGIATASWTAFGVDTGLTLASNDLLCLTDKIARAKHVRKNTVAQIVVIRVKKELVFVPNIDSTPEKLSTNPPPLPLWIKTKIISNAQAIT